MSMTVSELKEILEDVLEKHGDIDVRIAHQPRWAFEYSVDRNCGVAKAKSSYGREVETAFYLSEGTQIGYLPHTASLAVGWSEQDYDDEDEEGRPVEGEDFETY